MNYKILMVDDDRELLKMLNQYFTLKNYTVMIAENGIEAMEKISANPDIILLDVNMPGMDGIEVCRRIRDMVSCPIIFLTAKVEEQDRVMGLLSGGDDYVLKPFSLKELDARIIAHLKREERLHRKKEQALEMVNESKKQIERMDIFVETMRKMSSLDTRELVAEEITSKQVEIDVRAEMNVFRKKFGKLYELECSETEEKFSGDM